jgi:hypothetical protein
VSDDPEFFPDHGVLFRAPLQGRGTVVRILFDHVNSTVAPMRVLVGVANLEPTDGSMNVLGATAGPFAGAGGSVDTFTHVGHVATVDFLRAHELGHGGGVATRTVPARGQTLVLTNFPALPAGGDPRPGSKRGIACVAGIFDLEPLDDNRYEIRVLACSPQHGMEIFNTIGDSNPDGFLRRGVFDISSTVGATAEIAIDGAAARIGDNKIASQVYPRASIDPYRKVSLEAPEPHPDHTGEFGVLKRFFCGIPAGETVRLMQSARGGSATASYVIDGKFVLQSELLRDNADRDVVVLVAPDAGDRRVEIVAMTDINSMEPFSLAVASDTTGRDDGTLGPTISAA